MMTSMLTDNAQVGDQVFRDGAVAYTIIWDPIVERTTAFWRVRWAWDGGECDRTMPLGVDMPNLVRPTPPPPPDPDPDPTPDPDPDPTPDPDPDDPNNPAEPVDPPPPDPAPEPDPEPAPDPEPEQPTNP